MTGLLAILDWFDEPLVAGALIARFELGLLDDLGFGLDLERCAATGTNDDLAYVSPKSGRAVSRSAGEPYGDRLLEAAALPAGAGLGRSRPTRTNWRKPSRSPAISLPATSSSRAASNRRRRASASSRSSRGRRKHPSMRREPWTI